MITAIRPPWLHRAATAGLTLAALAVGGCAPALNPEEYGQVIYELPKAEEVGRPYELPEFITDEKSTAAPDEEPEE